MSNLIKAEFAKPDLDKKVIRHQTLSLIHSIKGHDTQSDRLVEVYGMAEKVLEEAKSSAQAILEKANKEFELQMQKITEQKNAWEEEKAELMEEAKAEGYHSGFMVGKQEGFDACKEQITAAQKIVEQSKVEARKHIEASEKTILELSLKVAEQILDVKLSEDPEIFTNIVKKVLKESKGYHDIHLYIHPTKYSFIIQHKDELLAINNREKNLLIYPDEDIDENGCILESSFGRVVASVDSQLIVIKEKLLSLLEEE